MAVRWEDHPTDDSDPLAPARGVVVGAIISLPVWGGMVALAVLAVRAFTG